MRFKHFIILLPFIFGFKTAGEISTVRTYFEKGRNEKTYAEKLKQITGDGATALLKAYNGSAWALLAKHHTNPYKKLEYVKKGLGIINSAVLLDAADVEIRFLRFSVEENIPAIVSFDKHLNADKDMMIANLKPSHPYYKTIRAYLMNSKNLSQAEKSKLP